MIHDFDLTTTGLWYENQVPTQVLYNFQLAFFASKLSIDKSGFLQNNLELSISYSKTTSLVSISLRVLKEYSWLCPWLFPSPDYEEEYQEDGPQEGYDN